MDNTGSDVLQHNLISIYNLDRMERRACSHQWIDPDEPAIERFPYSPIVGPGHHEMKPGRVYRCQNCGDVLYIATDGLMVHRRPDG